MSTIPTLLDREVLERVDGALRRAQSAARCLYALPSAVGDFNTIVAECEDDADRKWLQQQTIGLFNSFVSGAFISNDHPVPSMKHMRDGIWELKTRNLRFFGVVHCKDVFIILKIVLKDHLRDPSVYNDAIKKSRSSLDDLDLDEPKFLNTKSFSDAISNEPL